MRKSILLFIALSALLALINAEHVSIEAENGSPVELEKSTTDKVSPLDSGKVDGEINIDTKVDDPNKSPTPLKNPQDSTYNRRPRMRYDPWSIFEEFDETLDSLWNDDFFPTAIFNPFKRRNHHLNPASRNHPFRNTRLPSVFDFLHDTPRNLLNHHRTPEIQDQKTTSNEGGLINTYGSLDILSDVKKLKDKYVIEASIPGYDKSEVTLNLSENNRGKPVLTIEGKKHIVNKEGQAENYVLRERSSSFSRSYVFDSPIVDKEAKAVFDKGILSIELPYNDTEKSPKRIEIQ